MTQAHLQQLCEGHSSCTYRVDYKVIGDPSRTAARSDQRRRMALRRPIPADVAADRRARGRGYGSTIELRLRLTFGAPVASPVVPLAGRSEVERAFRGC